MMRKLTIWIICLFFLASPCYASQIDGAVETPTSIGAEPAQTAASQVEAEAGSEAGIRSWSPLRVFQGITSWWDNTGRLAPGEMGATTPFIAHTKPRIVHTATGTVTLTAADSGTIYDNSQASGDVTISAASLECVAATEGFNVSVLVQDTTNELYFDQHANDQTYGMYPTSAGGDRLQGDKVVGSVVKLVCTKDDAGAYNWLALGMGEWVDAN